MVLSIFSTYRDSLIMCPICETMHIFTHIYHSYSKLFHSNIDYDRINQQSLSDDDPLSKDRNHNRKSLRNIFLLSEIHFKYSLRGPPLSWAKNFFFSIFFFFLCKGLSGSPLCVLEKSEPSKVGKSLKNQVFWRPMH